MEEYYDKCRYSNYVTGFKRNNEKLTATELIKRLETANLRADCDISMLTS